MTNDRNFKRLVRDRMVRTGERYATARAHVLSAGTDGPASTDLFRSVGAVGGHQPDLAAARNLCINAGVVGPDGVLTEALAFGLAGGIGFLYGVFEYADGPTMTIVCRNESMPDPFCEPLFTRVGATAEVATTGGTKKAAAQLDAAIAAERPSLCTVGAGALPYLGESPAMAGMAPHLVGLIGTTDDGTTVLIDDRSPEPIAVDRPTFDLARAAYGKAKHRMITIDSVDPEHDWTAAVTEAVMAGAEGFDTPPVPQFASNVGMEGLRKFHRLLTDERDPKRWTKVFPEGRLAAIGLSRLHDCIDHAYTAPSAGRPLHAAFLDEAVAIVEQTVGQSSTVTPRWTEAAERFRRSGEAWAEVVDLAVGAHPELARYGELAAERAAGLDGAPDSETMVALGTDQAEAVDRCDIDEADARRTYGEIAERVGLIIDEEDAALALLRGPA